MDTSLIDFPCDFPIKIVGKNTATFQTDIVNIIQQHKVGFDPAQMKVRLSQNQAYCALTVTVHVNNKEMLDQLYHKLTQYPDIQMVL